MKKKMLITQILVVIAVSMSLISTVSAATNNVYSYSAWVGALSGGSITDTTNTDANKMSFTSGAGDKISIMFWGPSRTYTSISIRFYLSQTVDTNVIIFVYYSDGTASSGTAISENQICTLLSGSNFDGAKNVIGIEFYNDLTWDAFVLEVDYIAFIY